jgi:Ankyrin repeats (3 copies)
VAQTLHPPLSTTPSDTLGTSQYTPSVGQRDVDIAPHIPVSAHDPDDKDNDGGMLLSRPKSSPPNTENSQVVRLQLAKSEDVNGRTPLWYAISSANMVELNRLLNTDNIQLNKQIGSGETPLSLAVKNKNEDVVKLLLDTGRINVNLQNAHGQIPLSLAVEKRNKAIVKLLLKTRKVDVFSSDWKGEEPLKYAAEVAAGDNDTELFHQIRGVCIWG